MIRKSRSDKVNVLAYIAEIAKHAVSADILEPG